MKHLLSIEELNESDMSRILTLASKVRKKRGVSTALEGETWGLIFTKSSTRTRVSFQVGIRELGGESLFLSNNEIQLGRGESIADTARVLSRFLHGVIIRTFAQNDLREFAKWGAIPVVNALTDEEHPCQILADLFTIGEKRGAAAGKKIAFIGDGACNVCRSWLFAAAKIGFELAVGAPKGYQPDDETLARVEKSAGRKSKFKLTITDDCKEAAKNADVLYTDVWVSMGKEGESAQRMKDLAGYQINAGLLQTAKKNALVMHCLPAYRGKEIADGVFEAHAKDIFDQAENRLHVQKAILTLLSKQGRKGS